MVYFETKKVKFIFFLFFVLLGCKNSKNYVSVFSENEVNKQYCFEEIENRLTKIDGYTYLLEKTEYSSINRHILFKLLRSERKDYLESVFHFFEGSKNVEAYLMGDLENRSIILIGKALGATGIGVEYWNYQFYQLTKNEPVIEFSSLIKSPYSVYIDSIGELKHLEIEDVYPRPANGEDLKLDFIPLQIHVFNGIARKSTIEFHCYPD